MIRQQIKIHDEPVVYASQANNFDNFHSYKVRPSTKDERDKEIDEELLRLVEVDARIGDVIVAKNNCTLEIIAFRTEDTNLHQIQWYGGFPCCLVAKNVNYPNGSGICYSFDEIDWTSHKKIGDRIGDSNTVNSARIKQQGASV